MRRISFVVMVVLTLACGLHAQTSSDKCSGLVVGSTPQLREVLEAACVPFPVQSSVNAGQPITSYEVLNGPGEFVLAYYLATSSGLLEAPLRLLRYDKQTEKWGTAEFSDVETEVLPGVKAACLGSAIGLTEAGGLLYVGMHLSPSAECLLVLSDDLKLKRTLYGWPVASFSSGAVVLQKSMVHFSPTHPMELSLFDPRYETLTPIYPPQSDPLRASYAQRLRTAISPSDRCEGENCEIDAQRFENEVASSCPASGQCRPAIAINEKTGSLVFIAQFNPIGFLRLDEVKDSPEWSEQVVYVYKLFPGPVDHREFRVVDMKARFGVTSPDALLTPDVLSRVFQ